MRCCNAKPSNTSTIYWSQNWSLGVKILNQLICQKKLLQAYRMSQTWSNIFANPVHYLSWLVLRSLYVAQLIKRPSWMALSPGFSNDVGSGTITTPQFAVVRCVFIELNQCLCTSQDYQHENPSKTGAHFFILPGVFPFFDHKIALQLLFA